MPMHAPTRAQSRIRLASGEHVVLRHVAEGACPFCKLSLIFGYTEDGAPCTAHDEPYCETFDRLDPADFYEACRLRTTN